MLSCEEILAQEEANKEQETVLQEPVLPPRHHFVNGFIVPDLPRKKTIKDHYYGLVWKMAVGS